ncbi:MULTISPECIES: Wzz/FepE/Etk N-terminal domain-containing protein [unclassified Streptomyces]|uniref:Wzz/FepE/Etk N-terminal domain-containing protein n=1 Tax=unclassified Streptomyces TaxID=2593676 RepID=UPI0033B0DEE3
MNDDTIRLVTIGRIIRRRWRLLTILALVGALVGYGTSLLFPAQYTTSASVLLPGAWEERELLTQEQVATSSVVVDQAADTLHWAGVSKSELRSRVSAKAADGNIIKISGTAETPERAQQLSDQVAQQFVTFAARVVDDNTDPEAAAQREALQQSVTQTSRRITQLADAADPQTVEGVQARTELEKLRTTLQEAITKLNQSDPAAKKANMVVMGAAARPTSETPPTRTQFIAAGALLFLLLGVIGHLTAARMSRRLRTQSEIAAALGSTLLGTVDVADERSTHRPEVRGPRAAGRRLLGVDVRWDVPAPRTYGDESGRQIRYRRVCNRLPAARRLLVVVPDGDGIALRAAGELVSVAGNDPSPNSSNGGHPVLRTVGVSVSQPLVPDRGDESGALVVLSSGNWTAAELSGIAEACADAGHEIVGIVLAGMVRALPARAAGHPRDAATPVLAVGHDVKGSSG